MRFYKIPVDAALETPAIAKNSEAFTVGDAVYVDTDGFLCKVTTSSRVMGFVMETFTATADNQTVKKYKPTIVPGIQGVQAVIPAASALAQTDISNYADMATVTSGAQVLNATTDTKGQFYILDIDPEGEGTTTDIVVEVAEYQKNAYAQV